jgi:hypothetical protein
VCVWIERMTRPDPERQTGWLPDDALAPTLAPVLRAMADGVPMLVDAARALDEWADANARTGETPERVVGKHGTRFRGVELEVGTRPYTLWMLQRVLDSYRALGEAERARVTEALAGTGWEPLLELEPRHRLGKRRNELVWEA